MCLFGGVKRVSGFALAPSAAEPLFAVKTQIKAIGVNLQHPAVTYCRSHHDPPKDFKSSISMKLSNVIRSAGVGGINSMSKTRCPFASSVTGFLS